MVQLHHSPPSIRREHHGESGGGRLAARPRRPSCDDVSIVVPPLLFLFLLFFSPSLESRPPLGRLSPFKLDFETGFLINRVFSSMRGTTPIGGFHFRIVIASVFF